MSWEPKIDIHILTPREVEARRKSLARVEEELARTIGASRIPYLDPKTSRRVQRNIEQFTAHIEHEKAILRDGGWLVENLQMA